MSPAEPTPSPPVPTRRPASPGALAAAWLVVAAAVATVSLAGPLARQPVPLIAAWLVGGAAWLAAVRLGLRGSPGRGSRGWIVAGAVALRLIALAGAPGLSDDHVRYAWEGALLLEGVSPYGRAPDDAELAPWRERWPELHAALNHPDVPAAYPPLTQAACAAVVELAGGPEHAFRFLRAAFALCDLLVLWPLARLAARRGRPPGVLFVWAWSPLVALEFAGAGHFDALGILLLVAALAWHAAARERDVRTELLSLIALAGAILTKLLPLAALPFVARGDSRGPARGPGAAARIAVVAALYALAWLPFLLLGSGPHGPGAGLGAYGLRWESPNLVYRFVEPLLSGILERDGTWHDLRLVGRAAVGTLWLAVGVVHWRRRSDAATATGALVAAFLLLSPTLHPWYLTWILPFLALRPSAAWLALAALAPLLYAPLAGWVERGAWVEPPWLWPAVALPVLALLALEHARRFRASDSRASER